MAAPKPADLTAVEVEAEAAAPESDPPRPPTNDDILEMMAQAEQAAAEKKTAAGGSSVWNLVSFWLLWGGVAAAFAAIAYVVVVAEDAPVTAVIVAASVFILVAVFLAATVMKAMSPVLVTGALLHRAAGQKAENAAGLAGIEILKALGLAEGVLEGDEDAWLVARRDGVVTYANAAYRQIADEAGLLGAVGLPPRIDRLFALQGQEAAKVFRLCRAAKSGEPATETVCQHIGADDARRRFEVSVRSIPGADEHVAWRLREIPFDDNDNDVLAASYADFPAPVFAIEKSGQIIWTNAALRDALGVERNAIQTLDQLVYGETANLLQEIWRIDRTPQKAVIRKGGESADAEFVSFRRGGVGEGVACVALSIEKVEDAPAAPNLSADILESPFGVAIIDGEIAADAKIAEANKAFTEIFDVKKNAALADLLDKTALGDLVGEVKRRAKSAIAPKPIEITVGEGVNTRIHALYARPVKRRRGSYGARRTVLYSVDITDRKRMEQDYAQDQKLRGIGELASKVAHDFNNYLQVVLGHCERLMLKHPAGDPAYQELVQIRENAQRAANTTKQLLAFSRKQTLKREVVSITDILNDFSRFLTRAIGEKVSLDLVNGRALPNVRVDKYQLETVLMNLAVNARDAMGEKGGKLTISTRAAPEAELEGLGAGALPPQDYLLIEVSDDGPGVPADIRDKIFDPFFTTKDVGKGTGLGLATVYGVIAQMDGAVILKDGEDDGATFQIFLPAFDGEVADAAVEEAEPAPAEPDDVTGDGRILVVEDEDPVRTFVIATLTDCGYQITQACDGEEALEIIEQDETPFDLVISDVMMPIMDGPSFVQEAREKHDLKAKVIFMSAYAEEAVRDQLDIIEGAGYIQKPFTLKNLAATVKRTLSPEA